MRPLRWIAVVILVSGLLGCGGPYSYARAYVPSAVEKPLLEQAKVPNWAAVDSRPQDFDGQLIAWFGVVLLVETVDGGQQLVRLKHAVHQDRHLCKGESPRSCRVTISDASSGEFSALLTIDPAHLTPSLDNLQPGSLLHVFGKVRCAVDEDENTVCERDPEGSIRLEGVAYRHFPPRHYVTPRMASEMRL